MFTNWLTSSVTTSASPPDVILEIGPLPFTRFAAHSHLLAAHSGYLRSMIRPDDRTMDAPIYVPNVTAEHFAPLLTYMYTGFLDLNIENIFGVLLATHVLHMPRALEICRAFLARVQSDRYFGSNFMASPCTAHLDKHEMHAATGDAVKVIRPIASKATINGLAFVAPPTAKPLLPSHDTPFRSLNVPHESATNWTNDCLDAEITVDAVDAVKGKRTKSPVPSTSKDDTTETTSPPASKKQTKLSSMPPNKSHRSHKRLHKPKIVKTHVIEVAVLDSVQNMDDNNPDKIVIDVASCDGPVRFQRVLNSAYGQFAGQPKPFGTTSSPSSSSSSTSSTTSSMSNRNERNRLTVANSFHMQMARNISEHHSLTAAADSENSQEIIVHDKSDDASDQSHHNQSQCHSANGNSIVNSGKSDELYNCVYCKHTFKSQYCYQKHAKRHINPLSIDGEAHAIDAAAIDSESDRGGGDDGKCHASTTGAKGAIFKREVRPLDMNVQYYPCKTCGSKFPSYYFVHKHRKMCHANEEN